MGDSFTDLGAEGCCRSLNNALLYFDSDSTEVCSYWGAVDKSVSVHVMAWHQKAIQANIQSKAGAGHWWEYGAYIDSIGENLI